MNILLNILLIIQIFIIYLQIIHIIRDGKAEKESKIIVANIKATNTRAELKALDPIVDAFCEEYKEYENGTGLLAIIVRTAYMSKSASLYK